MSVTKKSAKSARTKQTAPIMCVPQRSRRSDSLLLLTETNQQAAHAHQLLHSIILHQENSIKKIRHRSLFDLSVRVHLSHGLSPVPYRDFICLSLPPGVASSVCCLDLLPTANCACSGFWLRGADQTSQKLHRSLSQIIFSDTSK